MRILHLEDSRNDAELTAAVIHGAWPDCEIRRVERRDEFAAALAEGGFDVILSDYTLPDFDGLWALDLARARDPARPFIFLSGTIGEERAVEALRHGATDYVIKDRPTRLVPAIRQALDRVEGERRQRRAEERLREQAELLDRARDAICVVDLEHRVTYWNASAERLYGWSVADAVGRDLVKLLFPREARRYRPLLAKMLSAREWHGEVRQVTRQGGDVVVDSRWTLVCDATGQPRSILLINTDVTERRRLETQLLRVQRLESLGTLTGGIAHDLNNVLAPILLAVEALRKRVSGESDLRLLATLEASTQRGAALIRQLLTFARGSEARRTEVRIREIVADVEKLVRQTLPPSIRLEVTYVGEPWPVIADPTQLGQILMNLCVNARDAMPQGGSLEIACGNVVFDAPRAHALPSARPGPYLRVSVRDTGTGIAPEIIDKIFDPFFTTKAPGKGTGLGLSTVMGILKGHEGCLEVLTEIGRGTTFHVYLPAVPGESAPAAAAAPARPTRGRGERILVIDDDAALRDVLAATLRGFGYQVVIAPDGRSGLGDFHRQPDRIDLVMIAFPVADPGGGAVIRDLQAARPGLPIVVMSSLLEAAALRREGISFERLELLSKPVVVDALLATVARQLAAP